MPDLSELCECGHTEENHGAGMNAFCWESIAGNCTCQKFKPMSKERLKMNQVARVWHALIRRIASVYGSDYIIGTSQNGVAPRIFVLEDYGGVAMVDNNATTSYGANTLVDSAYSDQIKATWERVKDRVSEIEELSLEIEEATEKIIMSRRKLATESNGVHGGDGGGKDAQ